MELISRCCFDCKYYPGETKDCPENQSLLGCSGKIKGAKPKKCPYLVDCKCNFFKGKGPEWN